MHEFPDHLGVQGAGTRALLSLSGCLSCRCYHDRLTQNTLGDKGAIEALVGASQLLLGILEGPLGSLPAEDQGTLRKVLCDAVHALHFLCLNNLDNAERLGDAGGFSTLLEVMAASPGDAALQSHGCVVLCELASRDDVSPLEIKECLEVLLDRLGAFREDREASSAIVWSLSRLLSLTLKSPLAGDFEPDELSALWRRAQDASLPVLMGMIQGATPEAARSEEARILLKHCLDLIAVLAPSMQISPADEPEASLLALSLGKDTAGGGAAAAKGPRESATLDGLVALTRALALTSADLWIQAVAVRALYFVMCHREALVCPSCSRTLLQQTLPSLIKIARGMRQRCPKPNKETFTFHIYALAAIQHFRERALREEDGVGCAGEPELTARDRQSGSLGIDFGQHATELHLCTEYALRYLDSDARQDEDFDFDIGDIDFCGEGQDDLDTGCCKYSYHCYHFHESVKGKLQPLVQVPELFSSLPALLAPAATCRGRGVAGGRGGGAGASGDPAGQGGHQQRPASGRDDPAAQARTGGGVRGPPDRCQGRRRVPRPAQAGKVGGQRASARPPEPASRLRRVSGAGNRAGRPSGPGAVAEGARGGRRGAQHQQPVRGQEGGQGQEGICDRPAQQQRQPGNPRAQQEDRQGQEAAADAGIPTGR